MKKNPQTLPQKQTKRQKTKETTDQKQVMGLGVECWVACVGLILCGINF